MKILVVSDAHGNIEDMKKLLDIYPNMDYYLDAGDNLSSVSQLTPYRSVKGNCDFYPFDEKAFIRTSIGGIFMRHLPYILPEEKKGVKIFIHGHTHHYKVEDKGDYVQICPGSTSLPKDDSNGSYAIITIEDSNVYVDIIDIFSKKVLLHYEIM